MSNLTMTQANSNGAEFPQSINIQPDPLIVQVGYLVVEGRTVTSITRRWAEDRPRGCRLCPIGTCTAYRGVCTVMVGHRVPPELAELYDVTHLAWGGAGRPFRLVSDDAG